MTFFSSLTNYSLCTIVAELLGKPGEEKSVIIGFPSIPCWHPPLKSAFFSFWWFYKNFWRLQHVLVTWKIETGKLWVIGYTKDPPPPPKNSVVDNFCFFSATRLMPTSARIKILDPLGSPAKTIWAEVTFLRWLQGYPPRIVFLRPSRTYRHYRFQDYSFWRPPPPPAPPRKRLRFRIAP